MTEHEMQHLKVLASRALFLAHLRDRQRITENEYIEQLNALRQHYGLWPIRTEDSSPNSNG
jgi:hypothetical protein